MFSGLTLNFQNQTATTIYGIKSSMKDALRQYEDSLQKYNAYQRKTVAGNILMWGGLAAVIGGVYMPFFAITEEEDSTGDMVTYKTDEKLLNISIGMLLGGMVSNLIGSIVLQSGQASIFDAVHVYNRHKIGDYQ
jgi:hypothetical protein